MKWAEATGDDNKIHLDQEFARRAGLEGVIVHGRLGLAWLGQMVTSWMGDGGELKILSGRYQKILYPNQTVVAKGRVINKYLQNGEHLVEIELWLETETEEAVTRGRALVRLPSKKGEARTRSSRA